MPPPVPSPGFSFEEFQRLRGGGDPAAPTAPAPAGGDFSFEEYRAMRENFQATAPVEDRVAAEATAFGETMRSAKRAGEWMRANPREALVSMFEREAGDTDLGRYSAGKQAEAAEAKLKTIYEHAGQTVAQLRRHADAMAAAGNAQAAADARQAAAELEHGLEVNSEGQLTAESFGRAGRGAVATIGKVIDLPHKGVRVLTQNALDPNRPADAPTMTMDEWQAALRKSENPLIQAGLHTAKVVGLPVALAGGSIAAGLGVGLDAALMAKDLASGVSWEEARKPSWQGVKDAFSGAIDSGQELVTSMGTDPTTFFSFASGSAGKNALAQASRALRASAVPKATEQASLGRIANLLESVPGTAVSADGRMSELGAQVFAELKASGVSDDVLRLQFGENGALLGKGGPALEVPLTDLSLPLSKAVGAVSPKLGAAVDAPLARLGAKLGVTNPVKEAVQAQQQVAAGRRDALTQQFDEESYKLIEEARAAGITTPQAWDELVRRTLDPAYDVAKLQPGQAVPANARVVTKDGVDYAVTAKPDYVPLNTLSPEVQKFAASARNYFGRRQAELAAAGRNLDSENLLTREYVPRQYERVWDPLFDDINVDVGVGGRSAPTMARGGELGGGTPLGDVRNLPTGYAGQARKVGRVAQVLKGELSGQTDFSKILPRYNRRVSTAVAKGEMLAELSKSGLAKLSTSPEVVQQPHLWRSIGKYSVPERYGRMLDQVFADQPINMSSIARYLGAEGSPLGRAVLQMTDLAARTENHWKGLVLNWRPGYHIMNVVNDTQYLLALGAKNPAGWVMRAKTAIQSPARATKLVRIGKTGTSKTTRELVAEAQSFGFGRGSTGRSEAVGQGLSAAERGMGRVAAGKSRRSVLDKGLDVPGAIADGWTDTARVAAYMVRRSLGDTPAAAARAVRIGMVDYQTSTLGLRALRFLMPFATFAARGPQTALYHAARSPRAVIGSMRATQAFTGEDKPGVTPRSYWAERGATYPLSEGQQGAFNKWRELWGGTPIPETDQARVLARDAFQDPFTMPAAVAGGAYRPAINSLNPIARMAMEAGLGRDLQTDQPMDLGWEPLNAETPAWAGGVAGGVAGLFAGRSIPAALAGAALGTGLAAGDWAEADSNQGGQGWLARGFGTFLPPPVNTALSAAARNGIPGLDLPTTGEISGSPAQFGSYRLFDARGNPNNTLAGQGASQLTGFSTFTAGPMDDLFNAMNSPETLQLLKDIEHARRRQRELEMLYLQGR